MHEERVFHVLGQTLQEAERLVEDHRHCNLGELLERRTTDRVTRLTHFYILIHGFSPALSPSALLRVYSSGNYR